MQGNNTFTNEALWLTKMGLEEPMALGRLLLNDGKGPVVPDTPQLHQTIMGDKTWMNRPQQAISTNRQRWSVTFQADALSRAASDRDFIDRLDGHITGQLQQTEEWLKEQKAKLERLTTPSGGWLPFRREQARERWLQTAVDTVEKIPLAVELRKCELTVEVAKQVREMLVEALDRLRSLGECREAVVVGLPAAIAAAKAQRDQRRRQPHLSPVPNDLPSPIFDGIIHQLAREDDAVALRAVQTNLSIAFQSAASTADSPSAFVAAIQREAAVTAEPCSLYGVCALAAEAVSAEPDVIWGATIAALSAAQAAAPGHPLRPGSRPLTLDFQLVPYGQAEQPISMTATNHDDGREFPVHTAFFLDRETPLCQFGLAHVEFNFEPDQLEAHKRLSGTIPPAPGSWVLPKRCTAGGPTPVSGPAPTNEQISATSELVPETLLSGASNGNPPPVASAEPGA
jgi:hypothetical protein